MARRPTYKKSPRTDADGGLAPRRALPAVSRVKSQLEAHTEAEADSEASRGEDEDDESKDEGGTEAPENDIESSGCDDGPGSDDEAEGSDDEGEEAEEGQDDDEDEDGENEDEDEDEDDGDSSVEQDALNSLSIKGALAEVLTGDLDDAGAFSFSKTYPAAPNPALNIDGFGAVGLPLSVRDAAGIKSFSDSPEHTHSSKAGLTAAGDKVLPNTWEIDASKVHFRNPAWVPFMAQTARDVCEALGVDDRVSKPRCKLYKLLLYETGAQYLSRFETEKVDGMFANIIIILPSEFTGGTVHVGHDGIHLAYDLSAGSLNNTSVVAWYTGVQHQLEEITSGFRLALSFNLVHTTKAPCPRVSRSALLPRLQATFQQWEQAGSPDDDVPQKIITLLEHTYPHAALRDRAYKGTDARLIAILDSVGKQYDIRIGLANLSCTVSGGDDDTTSSDREGWNYEPVEDTTDVDIEQLIDLGGKLIRDSVDYDLETELVPESLIERLTRGQPDKQKYGRRGEHGRFEHAYYRTALVIWPSWAHFDIVHGSEAFSYACNTIQQSTTPEATAEETELIEIILARATPSRAEEIIESVCAAAIRWKDPSLWFRAVKACDAEQSIDALDEDNIYRAISAFGFAKVKPCLERALEQDPSDVDALRFMDSFAAWVAGQRSKQVKNVAKIWIPMQRKKRWDALKEVGREAHKELTAMALRYKGVEFFETTVLPLIKSKTRGSVLLEYASYLSGETAIPAEDRLQMARDVLATAIANVDFYTTLPVTQRHIYSVPPQEPAQLERAKPYVKVSIESGSDDLLSAVVDKLVDLSGKPADVVTRRVKGVLYPLVEYIKKLSRGLPGGAAPPALRKLSKEADRLHVQAALSDSKRISAGDIPALVKAMIASEGPEGMIKRTMPKLGSLELDNKTLRALILELRSQRTAIDATMESLTPALMRLLKKYINDLDFAAHVPTHNYAYTKPAIDALEFCFQLQYPDACKYVTRRLLEPSQVDAKYVKAQLAPLVPDIRALLVKHQHPLTSKPFSTTFRAIMLHWVETVMGPPPPKTAGPYLEQLRAWARACDCSLCSRVRTFLTDQPEAKLSMERIGAPMRRHLEGFLSKFACQIVTFAMISTSPQGLVIWKARVQWVQAQAEGKQLLARISKDDAELRKILGSDYARIIAGLEGRAAAPGAAAGASGSKRPASDDDVERAKTKRRKVSYDEQSVIDLT